MKRKRPFWTNRNIKTMAVIVVFSLALTFSIIAGARLISRPDKETKPIQTEDEGLSGGEEVKFGNEMMPVVGDVDKSSYDINLFKQLENGRMIYDSRTVKTWTGIDVSAHRDEIDWEAVKSDGVDFAMIRVGWRGNTEGKVNLDEYFHTNMKGASEAGLEVGVYFYSQAISKEEAVEEAESVIDWIKEYKITYPVVFDWEYVSADARTGTLSNETLNECALAFCETIEKAGYMPMIYFNLDMGYRRYDLAKIGKYDFWLAEYDGAPTFYYNFQMLQYTSGGTVKGCDENVDLNLSFVDYAARSKQRRG